MQKFVEGVSPRAQAPSPPWYPLATDLSCELRLNFLVLPCVHHYGAFRGWGGCFPRTTPSYSFTSSSPLPNSLVLLPFSILLPVISTTSHILIQVPFSSAVNYLKQHTYGEQHAYTYTQLHPYSPCPCDSYLYDS